MAILSASGTAVTLYVGTEKDAPPTVTADKEDHKKRDSDPGPAAPQASATTPNAKTVKPDAKTVPSAPTAHDVFGLQAPSCTLCHIPYTNDSIPFPTSLIKCGSCRKARVPDILFMTIEPPPNLQITGMGCLIQARVCRSKRDSKGEYCAKEISDVSKATTTQLCLTNCTNCGLILHFTLFQSLPFLEYELHRQLLSKLKVKGMNALFGLTVQISVGDNMLVAIAVRLFVSVIDIRT